MKILIKLITVVSILIMNTIEAGAVGLSGTYTIGGNNPDYATLVDAINDLTVNDMAGNVTFNIRDGEYVGRIVIPDVGGFFKKLTIQSESGDSTKVIISDSATSNADNYVIKNSKKKYLDIKNVTLEAKGVNYGRVIYSTYAIEQLTISNCILKSTMTDGSVNKWDFSLFYADTSQLLQGLQIVNNQFYNGGYGVYYKSFKSSTIGTSNAKVNNNQFYNQSKSAIYLENFSKPEIISNYIESAIDTGFIALSSVGNDSGPNISKNRIYCYKGKYGLYIKGSALSGHEGRAFNNFILMDDNTATTVSGIYIDGFVQYWKILYNSLNITNTGTTSATFKANNFLFNDVIQNNVLANNGGGYSIYIQTGVSSVTSNNNDLYTTGVNLGYHGGSGGNKTNLAAWQATGLDANSVSVNPNYLSKTELRGCNSALDSAAAVIAGITKDIDGETRNASKPDIGADEFSKPLVANISANDAVCAGTPVEISGDNLSALYAWSTGDTAQSITYTPLTVDTITAVIYNACETIYDTVEVNPYMNPSIEIGNDTSVCDDVPFTLTAGSFNAIIWSTGDTTSDIIADSTDIYYVVVTDSNGCKAYDTINVVVNLIPAPNLPHVKWVCEGENDTLDPRIENALSYLWSTGANSQKIIVNAADEYTIVITDSNGCVAYDTATVKIDTSCDYELSDLKLNFKKYYGKKGYGEGERIIQSKDGYIYLIGNTDSLGGGQTSIFVNKMDLDGNIIWAKIYEQYDNDLYDVIATDGGGLLVSFKVSSVGSALIKIDKDGVIEWSRKYEKADMGGSNVVFNKLIATSDDGYLLCGNININLLIVKANSKGEMLWNKQIHLGHSFSSFDEGKSAYENADGSFIILAKVVNAFLSYGDYMVLKIDKNGNLLWNKSYGTNDDEKPHSMVALDNNNLLLASDVTLYSDANKTAVNFMMIDNNGDSLWSKTFNMAGDYLFALKNVVKYENGILFTAERRITASFPYKYVKVAGKIDLTGNIEWVRCYDTLANKSKGYILPTFENTLYMTGKNDSTQIVLYKMDSLGNTACDTPVIESNINYTGLVFQEVIPSGTINMLYTIKDTAYTYITSDVVWGINVVCTDTLVIEDTTNTPPDFIESLNTDGLTSIYPNPTSGKIFVQATSTIKHIKIYDYMGALIFVAEHINAFTSNINLEDKPLGTYILLVETDAGYSLRRIIRL